MDRGVFYAAGDTNRAAVYSIPSQGGTAVRHLDIVEKPWDVAPDGSRILAMSQSAPRVVLAIDLRSWRRSTLLAHPTWNLYWAAFSADARWVAFTAKIAPGRQVDVFISGRG